MDYYVDIEVRPDEEFLAHQLMNAIYAKLHRALVAQKSTGIGVSFPDVNASYLGTRLRLHGDLASLSALVGSDWLVGIRDYVRFGQLSRVPDAVQHRVVRRVQVKSNPERLRRRLMRRHNLDAQEAQRRIPDNVVRLTSLPFVQLHSTSTGQTYRLFIDHGPVQSDAVCGDFNSYGLGQVATVPWF